MSERIPHYFGEQLPPPPPPPPPTGSYRYPQNGVAAPPPPVPGTQQTNQQSYAYDYMYKHGRGNSVPGRPPLACPVSNSNAQRMPIPTQKNTTDVGSPIRNSLNVQSAKAATVPIPKKIVTGSKTNTVIPTKVWTCDACEITLESAAAYKAHRKSHVKCNKCSFEASPKLVKAHFQAVHGKYSRSGFKTVTVGVPGCRPQKFRICVGNRPEDIKQWIEQRKKRFPRSSATTTNSTPSKTELSSITNTTKNEAGKFTKDRSDENKGTNSGTGLSMLLAGYGSSDDDEAESDNECAKTMKAPTNPQNEDSKDGPLTNCDAEQAQKESSSKHVRLADCDTKKEKRRNPCKFFLKGSCQNGANCWFSHDIEGDPQQTTNSGDVQPTYCNTNQANGHTRRLCRYFQKGTCHNGANCTFSHEIKAKQPRPSKGNSNNNRKRKRGGHTSSDTLLRKLLENDVERESSFTMQLLKFIVDSNFFQDSDDRLNEKKKGSINSSDT